MVCEMDDMESRDIESYIECHDTGDGNVKVRRIVSYDAKIGDRYTRYEVMESDNGGFVPGQRLSTLPAEWSLVSCDFTDMEDRMLSNTVECYRSANGVIRIIHTISYDGKLGIRSELWEVVSSTDSGIHVGDKVSSFWEGLTRIECEEPDYMDRLIDTTETCYDTGKGTVKIRRQESLNGNLDVKVFDYKIIESTDPDHPINTTPIQTVINGWTVISCDLNIMDVDDCYEVGGHKIHLKGFRTINPALQDIKSILYVVYSNHPDYNVGDELSSMPDGAKVTICDYADKSQRHMVPVRECYEVADGRFYVEGSRLMDNNMVVERTSVMVLESSSPTYPVGTTLTSIPVGATIVACLCQTC